MSNALEYRGYSSAVEFSAEDRCFHGRIAGIRDLVAFEGATVDDLERNFRNAVNEYLAFCEGQGKKPDQPFRGTFQVRLKGDLHRRLALYAEQNHESINAATNKAIELMLDQAG